MLLHPVSCGNNDDDQLLVGGTLPTPFGLHSKILPLKVQRCCIRIYVNGIPPILWDPP
jgi:hypothetical protein